ncbi:hypothetical protein L1987_18161 [Smallanthus sonchifolius]|uniref:Uncharacterized protein n=1 Tax=Smallanthus sonchifolius TaxID=185202 RepID=A0ACB9J143_9ASTR|nr:hypothetical protein L1987_18161 [Smallanthus sonchifolius]
MLQGYLNVFGGTKNEETSSSSFDRMSFRFLEVEMFGMIFDTSNSLEDVGLSRDGRIGAKEIGSTNNDELGLVSTNDLRTTNSFGSMDLEAVDLGFVGSETLYMGFFGGAVDVGFLG